jgi:hypothetical protein
MTDNKKYLSDTTTNILNSKRKAPLDDWIEEEIARCSQREKELVKIFKESLEQLLKCAEKPVREQKNYSRFLL